MKPIIIVPPDVLSEDSIKILRDNELCVVVATDPAKVRFLDPIPAASQRTKMEHAAIMMSRKLLNGQWSGCTVTKDNFARLYVDLLVDGSPLDPNGTEEEQMQRIFNHEKAEETRRLARAEAKAERDAKKKTIPPKQK